MTYQPATPLSYDELIQLVRAGGMTSKDLLPYLKKGKPKVNGFAMPWAQEPEFTWEQEVALVFEWAAVQVGFDPAKVRVGAVRRTRPRSGKLIGPEEMMFEPASKEALVRALVRGSIDSVLVTRNEIAFGDDARGVSPDPVVTIKWNIRDFRMLWDWAICDWGELAVSLGDPDIHVKAVMALTCDWNYRDWYCTAGAVEFLVWWLGVAQASYLGEGDDALKSLKLWPFAQSRRIHFASKFAGRVMKKLGALVERMDDNKVLANLGALSFTDAVKGLKPGRTIGDWLKYAVDSVVHSSGDSVKTAEWRKEVWDTVWYLIQVRLEKDDPSYASYLWEALNEWMTILGLSTVTELLTEVESYRLSVALFESQFTDPNTGEVVALPGFPYKVRTNLRSAGATVRIGLSREGPVVPTRFLIVDPQVWLGNKSPITLYSDWRAVEVKILRDFESTHDADELKTTLYKAGLSKEQEAHTLEQAVAMGGSGLKGIVGTLVEGDVPVNLLLVKFKADKMRLILVVFTIVYGLQNSKGAIGQGLMFGLLTMALFGMLWTAFMAFKSTVTGTSGGLAGSTSPVKRAVLGRTRLAPFAEATGRVDYIGIGMVALTLALQSATVGQKTPGLVFLTTLFVMYGPVASFFKLQLTRRSQGVHVVALVVIIGMILFATTIPCSLATPNPDSFLGNLIEAVDGLGVRVPDTESLGTTPTPSYTPEPRDSLGNPSEF